MWIVKSAIVFLIVWGIWCLLWTFIFAANDVANGTAPAPIMVGIIVALFVTGWVMKRRKKGKEEGHTQMARLTFTVTGLEEGGTQESATNRNLRLVCIVEGGRKLTVWGSPEEHRNITAVEQAPLPCHVECDCIPAAQWAAQKYGHTYWVPQNGSLTVMR